MPGGNEYVVKLSALTDNKSLTELIKAMDLTKLKAVGMTAAFGAATAAVYKFIKSAAQTEISLVEMAKKQHKTVEGMRAQETALKAMGKTLNEVKKDADLKKTYEQIKKVNESLALPNMSGTIKTVKELQGAFAELKSIGTYAVNWIGARVLQNLEAPIKRIREYFKDASQWMRTNFHSVTMKISSAITAFARGIIGIVEGFGKIMKTVNSLPSAIKGVAGAIAGLVGLFASGPIGQILTLITAFGGFSHDYEVWQANRAKGLKEGDEGYTPVAWDWLWEIWDGADTDSEGKSKMSRIATHLVESLTKAIGEAWGEQDGKSAWQAIFGGNGKEGSGLLGGIKAWFEDEGNAKKMKSLGGSIIHFLSETIRQFGGAAGGGIGSLIEAVIGDGKVEDAVFTDNATGTTFAAGIGTFMAKFVEKIKKDGSFADAFKSGLGGGIFGTLIGAVLSHVDYTSDGGIQVDWKGIGVSIGAVGKTFANLFTTAIEGIKDVGGIIFKALGNALKSAGRGDKDGSAVGRLGDLIKSWGAEDSILGKSLSVGVASWFATDNFLGGIIGGLATAFKEVAGDKNKLQKLKTELTTVGTALGDILFGQVGEDGKTRSGGIVSALGEALSGLWEGIKPYFTPVWEGIKEGFVSIFSQVGEMLGPIISGAVDSLYKNGGPLIRWTMEQFGYTNGSSYTTNENGETTITDKTGKEFTWYKDDGKGGKTKPEPTEDAKKFMATFGQYFGINEYGEFNYTPSNNKFDASIPTGVPTNEKYGDSFFPGSTWGSLLNYVARNGSLPGGFTTEGIANAYNQSAASKGKETVVVEKPSAEKSGGGSAKTETEVKVDTTQAEAGLAAAGASGQTASGSLDELAGRAGTSSGNVQQLGTSSSNASSGMTAFASAAIRAAAAAVMAAARFSAAKPSSGKAWGGRIGSEGVYTVGEDGPEYIIPITKQGRAASLIKQMFGEMGSGFLQQVIGDFGLNDTTTIGGSGASLASAVAGTNISNTYTISAPVNINVHASGAAAEDVGQQAYDAAERHLLRTMRGVWA